jgi:hypothetical protein
LRGEVEPEDLSANFIVQLGVVTEPLNRRWFEHNTGQVASRGLALSTSGRVAPASSTLALPVRKSRLASSREMARQQ